MAFTVSISEADRLVVGVVHGVFELGMVADFSTAIRREAVPRRYDVLVDLRKCHIAISQNGLFQLPELWRQQPLQWQHEVLAPHLVISQDRNIFQIYETIANRTGYRMKFFVEEADAMQWLAEQRAQRS